MSCTEQSNVWIFHSVQRSSKCLIRIHIICKKEIEQGMDLGIASYIWGEVEFDLKRIFSSDFLECKHFTRIYGFTVLL